MQNHLQGQLTRLKNNEVLQDQYMHLRWIFNIFMMIKLFNNFIIISYKRKILCQLNN